MVRWVRKRAEVTLVLLRTNAGSQRTTLTLPKGTHHGLSVYLISERFHHHGHSGTNPIQSTAHMCYDVIEASDVLSSQGRHLQNEPF